MAGTHTILRQVSIGTHTMQSLIKYSTLTWPSLGFDMDEKTKAISIYTQHYCLQKAADRSKKEIEIASRRPENQERLKTGTRVKKARKTAASRNLGSRNKICHLQPYQLLSRGYCTFSLNY